MRNNRCRDILPVYNKYKSGYSDDSPRNIVYDSFDFIHLFLLLTPHINAFLCFKFIHYLFIASDDHSEGVQNP